MPVSLLGLLLLLAVPAAPEGGPGDRDPAAEVQALLDAYRKAEDAYYAPVRREMTDEERKRLPPLKADEHPVHDFLPRFRYAAERARGTDAALTALLWILDEGRRATKGGAKLMEEAMATVAEDHAASPRLEKVAEDLQHTRGRLPREAVARTLQTLVEKNPDRSVKGAAILSLAAIWSGAWPRDDEEEDQAEDAARETRAREWKEAGTLLHRAVRECLGTPWADRARGLLYEREHLQVGMEAPDFEAVDGEGKAFRLSDHRGKVVVLDFWAFGWERCRGAWPHHREMVKRFEGRPFALLGVNGDGPVEEVRARLAEAALPWRNALDGSQGKITTRWNVRSLPMLYVIDAAGVIRARGDLYDDLLDRPVRDLLDDMARAGDGAR